MSNKFFNKQTAPPHEGKESSSHAKTSAPKDNPKFKSLESDKINNPLLNKSKNFKGVKELNTLK